MANMPGVVLRHCETKEFLVSVNGERTIKTTMEKGEAKWFSGLNSVDNFIKAESLEKQWIPTPLATESGLYT